MNERNERLKLFISDILELKVSPLDNYYIFNNFKFRSIEIIGFVKYKKELQNNVTIYQVDDGTGVIECIHLGEEKAISQQFVGTKKISKLLLKKVEKIIAAEREVQIGSTVKIHGSIGEYKEKREILIKRLIPIMDKNEELFHLYEKLALYGEVYGTQLL